MRTRATAWAARESVGFTAFRRDRGMRAVPICPYVAKFLKKHEESADLADPVTPEAVAWLDGVLKR